MADKAKYFTTPKRSQSPAKKSEMRYQEAAEEEELEQMVFSGSLGQQQSKRQISQGAEQVGNNGPFEPSCTESSEQEGEESESDTNLFSLASKIQNDSQILGSCVNNDEI